MTFWKGKNNKKSKFDLTGPLNAVPVQSHSIPSESATVKVVPAFEEELVEEANRKVRIAVSSQISFDGILYFDVPVRIDGSFSGDIYSSKTITVSSAASLKGRAVVDILIVDGLVVGDIRATKRVEIRPSGIVQGAIVTGALVLDEGATLDATCSIVYESDVSEAEQGQNEAIQGATAIAGLNGIGSELEMAERNLEAVGNG